MEKEISREIKAPKPPSFGATLLLLALNVQKTQEILLQNKNPVSTEIIPDHKKTLRQAHTLTQESVRLMDSLIEILFLEGHEEALKKASEEIKLA